MTSRHFLVVPENPDEAMAVEHPASCPQHGHIESVRTFDDAYACLFEEEVRETGIEASFHRDDLGVPLFSTGRTAVLPGRYPIDFGLRLVDDEAGAA